MTEAAVDQDDSPPTPTIPSIFAPSSAGGVTLEVIIAQIQCMDARLDTLTTKLCQVNTCIGCIARRQAPLSGFVASPSLSLEASKDEDVVDGYDDDENEDASSFSDDETTSH